MTPQIEIWLQPRGILFAQPFFTRPFMRSDRALAGWLLGAVLLKGCPYHAILIRASRDHVPCMSSGHSPSLLFRPCHKLSGTCSRISVLFSPSLTCLKEPVKWGSWETATGRNGRLSREESTGLRVRPTCGSDPGSATIGYVALGKWPDTVTMWMSVNPLNRVRQDRTASYSL